MNIFLHRILLAATLVCVGTNINAQEWPITPVKIIVPFDAGSTPDFAARLIGERLAIKLHQPFIVENKSGAAGNIGTNAVAKAAPDGKTIGISIAGPLGVNSLLFKKMPYDVEKEIKLVTVAVSQPSVLVVGQKLTVTSTKQLLTLLKQDSNLSYASIGAGSISHLAMASMVAQAGGNAVHIPYRGSGAAVTALISGDVDMALLPAAAVMPHVSAGKLKALAVASPTRSPSLPDVPTLAESGLPNIKGDAWIGIIAPANSPPAVVKTLHDTVVQILEEPALKAKLRTQYMDPVGNSPEEFEALLQTDLARWKPEIEKNQINKD